MKGVASMIIYAAIVAAAVSLAGAMDLTRTAPQELAAHGYERPAGSNYGTPASNHHPSTIGQSENFPNTAQISGPETTVTQRYQGNWGACEDCARSCGVDRCGHKPE
ncbi:hypothetical protein PGT21_026247 [Puccinia graminis f. sp. tritici]|uniref:Secreted protein n=1 Tax=Puccinia graminis f. sp. tritici TaxID=56615 RepID=A0A5B0LRN6_PUCGR|nr:hypothetical protein PGT21_026247 [Puccinia graminis f. sp. tritici]KAA1072724.1 hypothetical protein PGTUg99_022641 [Puccinia graminis f. sp. tritici]